MDPPNKVIVKQVKDAAKQNLFRAVVLNLSSSQMFTNYSSYPPWPCWLGTVVHVHLEA